MVLLHGFIKKSQQTPARELANEGVSSGLILPQSHRFEFPIAVRAGAVD
jgi:hypothetical protein